MTDPLVVNDEIELPQLDISNNYTMDCTIPYSTGESAKLFPAAHNKRKYEFSAMDGVSLDFKHSYHYTSIN